MEYDDTRTGVVTCIGVVHVCVGVIESTAVSYYRYGYSIFELKYSFVFYTVTCLN